MWIAVRIPPNASTKRFDRSEVEKVLRTHCSSVDVSSVDEFDRRVSVAEELFSNDPSSAAQSVWQRTIEERKVLGPAYRFKVHFSPDLELEGGMKSYSVWFHSDRDITAEQKQQLIHVLTEIAAGRSVFHIY